MGAGGGTRQQVSEGQWLVGTDVLRAVAAGKGAGRKAGAPPPPHLRGSSRGPLPDLAEV